ncbi:antibiotic biosynthesis monooxygenase [Saccharopolyspora sp. TS4A08]|uniref:Antibiotic biosynthesis monooxygenase n=1 Tax=Saccharopolyspora ipomoeae TaxID=3042027 RepID=A0ABT6PLH3_9PSEU|nr:antibiotic biosynthesis monooxygenase [Saccharopolyspora sp. TS4A08]MDI2028695.1 antibiotic biosynthesis monooxygenase [Saccharopolyspora sp. TS4A08]
MSTTARVGRIMTFTATPGRGAELASIMMQVAEGLRGSFGCELYLVSRDAEAPDTVRVVEAWTDFASADAALATTVATHRDIDLNAVLGMLAEPPEQIDLDALGGVGL